MALNNTIQTLKEALLRLFSIQKGRHFEKWLFKRFEPEIGLFSGLRLTDGGLLPRKSGDIKKLAGAITKGEPLAGVQWENQSIATLRRRRKETKIN